MRLDEAPEAKLAGLLPGNLLIQWSHREELVDPAETNGSETRERTKRTETRAIRTSDRAVC